MPDRISPRLPSFKISIEQPIVGRFVWIISTQDARSSEVTILNASSRLYMSQMQAESDALRVLKRMYPDAGNEERSGGIEVKPLDTIPGTLENTQGSWALAHNSSGAAAR